jgi:hypothetical protein
LELAAGFLKHLQQHCFTSLTVAEKNLKQQSEGVFHQGFYIVSVLFCVQFLLLRMLLDKDIGLSDALSAALTNRSGTKSKPILLHNRLVCGLRLLQRRAKNGMCSSPAHLASMTPDCY